MYIDREVIVSYSNVVTRLFDIKNELFENPTKPFARDSDRSIYSMKDKSTQFLWREVKEGDFLVEIRKTVRILHNLSNSNLVLDEHKAFLRESRDLLDAFIVLIKLD